MGKPEEPVRHHHTPEVYLENFTNLCNSIAVMEKNTGKIFFTGPRAVGVENDFYTLDGSEDPYLWEKIYASGMDSELGHLLRKIISRTCVLAQSGTLVVSALEKAQLSVIMIMQLLRGKHVRDFERKIYEDCLPDIREQANNIFGPLSDDQSRALQAYIDKNAEKNFKQVAMEVALDSRQIMKYAKILCGHHFLFYRIHGNREFITSDNPVVFIDSRSKDARPFRNGLTEMSTMICYPITPKILLHVIHPEAFGGALSKHDCHLIDLDMDRDPKFIFNINRIHLSQCYRHAFAQSKNAFRGL